MYIFVYVYVYMCACSKSGHKICSQHFLGQKLKALMKVVSDLNSFQILLMAQEPTTMGTQHRDLLRSEVMMNAKTTIWSAPLRYGPVVQLMR